MYMGFTDYTFYEKKKTKQNKKKKKKKKRFCENYDQGELN